MSTRNTNAELNWPFHVSGRGSFWKHKKDSLLLAPTKPKSFLSDLQRIKEKGIASKLPPIKNKVHEKDSWGGFPPSSFPRYNMTELLYRRKRRMRELIWISFKWNTISAPHTHTSGEGENWFRLKLFTGIRWGCFCWRAMRMLPTPLPRFTSPFCPSPSHRQPLYPL